MRIAIAFVATLALGSGCGSSIGDGSTPDAGGGDSGDGERPPTIDAGASAPVCTPVELPATCTPSWYADAECDPSNNLEACEWDGGDCCPASCAAPACGDYGYDCRDPAAGGGGLEPPALIGDPCARVSDPLAADRLRAEVALLSSDELVGRRPGSTSDRVTRRYLEERFACLGLEPADGGCHQQPFLTDDGDPTANVIGVIPGSDPAVADQIIVVGAHHDHLGVLAGRVHNGANDNASGTAALAAIADAVARSATPPRRTLVFVAFGAEEIGLLGSIHYAAHPPAGLAMEHVVYMVNLDMLGTYDVADGVDGFGTFAGTPGRAILEEILVDHPGLDVALGVASPDDDSDYDPFCEAAIPYVYFETFDPPCWHEACDDVGRMDFAHMSELVHVLHAVVIGLASTDTDLQAARAEVGCGAPLDDQGGASPPLGRPDR
ncbi:MAG TPA: M28 family peptidase [Kofleriaceae bacterium]|jgi:hypothetical protein